MMRAMLLLLATVSAASAETYFAHVVGDDNIVEQVIVADRTFIETGAIGNPASWIETCMVATTLLRAPREGAARNCAGIGYKYDAASNCFAAPNTIPGATFDPRTCEWVVVAPIGKPGPKQ